jgi:hypothetical protein
MANPMFPASADSQKRIPGLAIVVDASSTYQAALLSVVAYA